MKKGLVVFLLLAEYIVLSGYALEADPNSIPLEVSNRETVASFPFFVVLNPISIPLEDVVAVPTTSIPTTSTTTTTATTTTSLIEPRIDGSVEVDRSGEVYIQASGTIYPQSYFDNDGGDQLAQVQDNDDVDASQTENDANWMDMRFNLSHDLIPAGKSINYFNVTCEHWESDGDLDLYYDYSTDNGSSYAGKTSVTVSEAARATVEYDMMALGVDTPDEINNFVFRWKIERSGGPNDVGYLDYCMIEYSWSTYGTLSVSMSSPTDNQQVRQNNTFQINATVSCEGEAGAGCGTVYAYARYIPTEGTGSYSYDGWNFDVTQVEEPRDIQFNGTHFWFIGKVDQKVHRYLANGTYDDWNFSVGTQETSPTGLYYNGTYFWVVGYDDNTTYRYLANGTYDNWNFDVSAQMLEATAVTFDGTYFWVVGKSNRKVYRYNANGDYDNWNFDVGEMETPTGIYYNGTYFWVVGYTNNTIYRYLANGTYDNWYLNVSLGQSDKVTGVTFNGTYFWVVDKTNFKVNRYAEDMIAPDTPISQTEATPFYITDPVGGMGTGNYSYDGWYFNVTPSGSAQPRDLTFNGTYFWTVDQDTDTVYRFLANGTYDNWNFLASGELTTPVGLTFNGTYFWVVGYDTDSVYRYDLNGDYTGWFFNASNEAGEPTGVYFNGTYFWVVDRSSNYVYRYDASGSYTGWSFNVSLTDSPSGIYFNGTYFWISSRTTAAVYRYDANGNYDNWFFNTSAADNSITGVYFNGTYFWITGRIGDSVYRYAEDVLVSNPQTSPETLEQGENWNVSWTVNATGLGSYEVDVFFNSSYGTIPDNDTDDATVIIRETIPPGVTDITVIPQKALNDTTVAINATVTDTDGVSFVQALLYYPNGTNFQNLAMTDDDSDDIYNTTTTAQFYPHGTYSITIWANNTLGDVNDSETSWFAPYLNLSDEQSITIDGTLTDWIGVKNVTDVEGDAVVISKAENLYFFREFFGVDASDNAGESVATGDFNNDGYADLVLGAKSSGSGSGVVYLWNTSTGNFSFFGEFFGVGAGDEAGWSVAVGDFNNDGYADFVLGAKNAEGGCVGTEGDDCGSGVVYLWNTTTGNFSYFGEFLGVDPYDYAGFSIASGDFNNDGYDDFVLGAAYSEESCLGPVGNDCGSGVVYLWNTTTGNFSYFGEFFGVYQYDEAGYSVAVGDFNNDGYADFLLGAAYSEGSCLGTEGDDCGSGVVYLWNTTTGNFSYFGEFFGVDAGDWAGYSVAVGDFNNDSYADFLLGAVYSEGGCVGTEGDSCGSGVVYLWNQSTDDFSYLGEFFGVDTLDDAGVSAATGDFNKDNYDDFVLGAFGSSGGCLGTEGNWCGSGVVYLWNQSTGNLSYLGEFFGVDTLDEAGRSVATGDFNNDNYADFVLGAHYSEGGCVGTEGGNCGSGVVYFMNTSNITFDLKTISLANDASYLYALVGVNGTVNYTGNYYRLFISKNDSAGSETTPDSNQNLPFKYDYMVESFNSSLWRIYNSSDANTDNVTTVANSSSAIEIAIDLSYLDVAIEDDINVTSETGSSSQRYDTAPDYRSFLNYFITGECAADLVEGGYCGCAAAYDGYRCDANVDEIYDGVCAYTGSAWTCDTNSVWYDGTDYRTTGSTATDGYRCESGAVGSDGFTQEGLSVVDGTVCGSLYEVICPNGLGSACYDGCEASDDGKGCDNTLTNGDYTQNGVCATYDGGTTWECATQEAAYTGTYWATDCYISSSYDYRSNTTTEYRCDNDTTDGDSVYPGSANYLCIDDDGEGGQTQSSCDWDGDVCDDGGSSNLLAPDCQSCDDGQDCMLTADYAWTPDGRCASDNPVDHDCCTVDYVSIGLNTGSCGCDANTVETETPKQCDSNTNGTYDGVCTDNDGAGSGTSAQCDSDDVCYDDDAGYQTYANDCDDCNELDQCDKVVDSDGYSADGVCIADDNNCCNQFANGTSSNNLVACGTEAQVCGTGTNTLYCDNVSDASWDAGNTAGTDRYRCDESETSCRLCESDNTEATGTSPLEGTDNECESGCGAPAACDDIAYGETSGSTCCYISGTCSAQTCTCTTATLDDAGDSCCYATSGDYCDSATGCTDVTNQCPDFCIDDNDGGTCAQTTRPDPTNAETCYWTDTCSDTGCSLTGSGTLRADYCDFCNDSGNQNGDFSPQLNATCDSISHCPNSGTRYWDETTGRSDDCYGDNATTKINTETYQLGFVYTSQTSAGACDDTECEYDCGTNGLCSGGVCQCSNPPSIGTLRISDGITPTYPNDYTVWCNATITDVDGYTDVTTVWAVLWDPATSTEGAVDDNDNHYTQSSCAVGDNDGDTKVNYSCSFTLKWYANPAQWTCKINATDSGGASDTNSRSDLTINSFIGYGVSPNAIPFGTMSVGETTTPGDEPEVNVTNQGTTTLDVNSTSSQAMSCTGYGTIPYGNIHYNTTSMTWESMCVLGTTCNPTEYDFDLAKRNSDDTEDPWKPVLFALQVPYGIGGTCSTTITMTPFEG